MKKTQLTLFRKSGNPVDPEKLKAYATEWAAFYDRAAERAGLDMLKLQRFTRFGERALIRKHGSEAIVDMPKSAKAWNQLIEQFEGTPIMVAQRADGKGLIGILMDEPFT